LLGRGRKESSTHSNQEWISWPAKALTNPAQWPMEPSVGGFDKRTKNGSKHTEDPSWHAPHPHAPSYTFWKRWCFGIKAMTTCAALRHIPDRNGTLACDSIDRPTGHRSPLVEDNTFPLGVDCPVHQRHKGTKNGPKCHHCTIENNLEHPGMVCSGHTQHCC